MRFVSTCFCAAILAFAAPAHAAWYEADSKHFIIYANENPKLLNEFATKLERFDQAVRFVRGMDDPAVGDANRLTIFVMPDVQAIQKLAGDDFVEGFYIGRASGSVAFVPRKSAFEDSDPLSSDTIFFHEYAHHLMFQTMDRPLPEWVVEGFAEFMSTVRFEKNGDIDIGAPANHRAFGLFSGEWLPIETMLSGNYSKITADQRESVYGRGWLLVHYLTFEKSRAGQLDRYAALLAKGVPSLNAAREAFGDLKQLDRNLDDYLSRNKLTYLRMPGDRFQAGNIVLKPLSQGGAKVILLRAQSKKGVDKKTAEPLAVEVRQVESEFPGDELVELTLAEAELDAGHPDASELAADRALKADPRDTKAVVLKGRAIEAAADKLSGDARRQAFEGARRLFLAANKIDTEDPEPLLEFYKTFVSEGLSPTRNAVAALHYASDLAPQDDGLRMMSGVQYLLDGKIADARRTLIPVAFDPHGNDLSQTAKTIMAKIDAGDVKGALDAASVKPASGADGR